MPHPPPTSAAPHHGPHGPAFRRGRTRELSDGKPEDYDEYKGDHAIEDTRHALIEAKAAGVHPFCITIDRQAHGCIAHMYGGVNCVFIDDVAQLPLRIPQIHRALTA